MGVIINYNLGQLAYKEKLVNGKNEDGQLKEVKDYDPDED